MIISESKAELYDSPIYFTTITEAVIWPNSDISRPHQEKW
jgi:hypothetical protein